MKSEIQANIAGRLRAIVDDAACRHCGTTAAECRRMFNDPRDPIGCCYPHDHTISRSAVTRLAAEVDSGEVAPQPPTRKRPGVSTFALLNQADFWYPKPPAEPVRVAEMDPAWRYNAARMLLRHAALLADRYSWGELAFISGPMGPSGDAACDAVESAFDEAERFRAEDPQGWMRTTRLYKVLTAGLPANPSKLYRLAERARHWGACPARASNTADCTCGAAELDRRVPVLVVRQVSA